MSLRASSSAALVDCIVSRCSATTSGGGTAYGGMMFLDTFSTLLLRACELSNGAACSSGDATGPACVCADNSNLMRDAPRPHPRTHDPAMTDGGALYLETSASASLLGCVCTNCVANTSSNIAHGGAMALATFASADVNGSKLHECAAVSHVYHAIGGGIYLDQLTSASYDASIITACFAKSVLSPAYGGAFV
eukprot:2884318-Prymnesium_polylepis.2